MKVYSEKYETLRELPFAFFCSAFTEGGMSGLYLQEVVWGVEHLTVRSAGRVRTTVGYTGGHVANPTYEEVCSGATGHAEAIEILSIPIASRMKPWLSCFLRSMILRKKQGKEPELVLSIDQRCFILTDEQRKIAQELIDRLKRKGFNAVTEVLPAGPFYPAETYHQNYYEKTGKEPYCHVRVHRF